MCARVRVCGVGGLTVAEPREHLLSWKEPCLPSTTYNYQLSNYQLSNYQLYNYQLYNLGLRSSDDANSRLSPDVDPRRVTSHLEARALLTDWGACVRVCGCVCARLSTFLLREDPPTRVYTYTCTHTRTPQGFRSLSQST